MYFRIASLLYFSLLTVALIVSPASAQTTEPQPVVQAVLFTNPLCTFCRQIVEQDLTPVVQKFGGQLQILYVDVNTAEGENLYQAALEAFEVPRGVPLLFVGQTMLGGVNIAPQLPVLVESYLAEGGMDAPAIPGLGEYLTSVQVVVTPVVSMPDSIGQTPPSIETAPVVRALMFWMSGCPHCEDVIGNVLPPLQAKYGSQLEILLVAVNSTVDVTALYEVASRYNIPKQQVGVPFLIIGEYTLVGSDEIAWEFPGLIESYLADGGVALPEILELEAFSSQVWFSAVMQDLSVEEDANVHILLFSTSDCNACQLITDQAQELLSESYSEQVTVEMIDVVTGEDVEYLYRVAAKFGVSKDQVNLPLVIIGDQILIGEDIPEKLPVLVETYLQLGGVGRPDLSTKHSDGFTLAVVIMALMGVALLYSLAAFAMGKTFSLPTWADGLIPALIILGIGVAGYLAYVETLSVEAVCGPVGDCNTVQQSRYATLFGFLPVGVLGLLGYLGLIAAWLTRKYLPKFAKPADLAFFGMAFFAVLFSLYLTYLEPFVIRAVCIWCLTSAVIVTILLVLGTPSAVRQFTFSYKDD